MKTPHIDEYISKITPRFGDPTFSLLKSHLLLEELLRAHHRVTLPHPTALSGARLTFAHLLAISRATSVQIAPDHWIWKAIGDLNKLRNLLAHKLEDSQLDEKIDEYVQFVISSLGTPLPQPAEIVKKTEIHSAQTTSGPRYVEFDMATIGMYSRASFLLGIPPDELVKKEVRI